MSKDFDTTLSAAIDLAAAAAQTTGASAARSRGRKRAVRKRIAVSTVSAVLVAVGATTAFEVASPHGGVPQMTGNGPQVTATATQGPSQTANPRATTSSSPSQLPGATQSTASSSPPSGSATSADPHHVVGAAWLDPGQLPFAATFHWKTMPANSQGSSPIGQPLTATVFYVAKDTAFQALTMCADPANLLGRTIGAQHAEYTASTDGSGNTASQFIFFFANTASAQNSFAWLQSQYGSSCLAGGGMTITKTAGDGLSSAAWLSRKGATGPVDAAPYTREYFVLRGNTIAYVSVSSTVRTLPTTYDDAAQLSTIAAHLCVYGGPCH